MIFIILMLLITYVDSFVLYNNLYTFNQINSLIKNNKVLPKGNELYKIKSDYYLNGPLNNRQINYFFDNGFLIVENLVNDNLLKKMQKLNFEKNKYTSEYSTVDFNSWEKYPVLLEAANEIGKAVAQLTPIVSHSDDNLHIVKDAFFIFNGGVNGTNKGCDWHIDDLIFWPSCLDSLGPGINAWLTLDDIDENGGGMCIAPGSHSNKFIECRESINYSSRKLIDNKIPNTCLIKKTNPKCKKILDSICYAPQLKAGDVILSTRFLFHRTSEFNNPEKSCDKKRYTIRYMPSSSKMDGIEKYSKKNVKYYPNKTVKTLNNSIKYWNKFPKIKLNKELIKKYNYDDLW